MSLIGILTESNHQNYLKQEVKKITSQDQIIFLNENCIRNVKNITFETVLLGKKVENNKKDIIKIIEKADNLIFNTDIIENISLLDNLHLKLITYGFNSKSTITTSSISENKIIICLQRGIQNIKGEEIEPQELQMNIKNNINSYEAMELASLKLLYADYQKALS
ncbi:MAG: hypothetical protein ACI4UU_01330 [Clostridia bacterium]